MSTTVLRTAEGWWIQTHMGAIPIDTPARTTAELLADRASVEGAVGDARPVNELVLLSPVTAPCRVVAQMTNYRSHIVDSGMDPHTIPMTFFRKTSGSICGPTDEIVRPPHVGLLDYEVELGLVIGKPIPVGTTVDSLSEYAAGLVITNDVSARDVQLPKTQFYEAKSYPTFTPVGPALVLLDADEWGRLDQLRMRLEVNGELRQDTIIGGDIVYPPLAALQSLSAFQRLDPGDLLLTGTPVGTALSAPGKAAHFVSNFLPPAMKWGLFFKGQARNPRYLRDGDVVTASIATGDGSIDLGSQRNVVRHAR